MGAELACCQYVLSGDDGSGTQPHVSGSGPGGKELMEPRMVSGNTVCIDVLLNMLSVLSKHGNHPNMNGGNVWPHWTTKVWYRIIYIV